MSFEGRLGTASILGVGQTWFMLEGFTLELGEELGLAERACAAGFRWTFGCVRLEGAQFALCFGQRWDADIGDSHEQAERGLRN